MPAQEPQPAALPTIAADPSLLAEVAGKWQHLVRLDDLVRHLARVAPMPVGPAECQVLAAITGRYGLVLFRDRGRGQASPVSDADRFTIATDAPPPRPPVRADDDDGFRSGGYRELRRNHGQAFGYQPEVMPALPGRAGALAWMQKNGIPPWLALLHADALQLVAELAGRAPAAPVLTLARPPAPDLMPQIIQPAGGTWPHRPGDLWTDAERVAMFKMRHLLKMADQQIATAVGVNLRQNISNQIGGPVAWKTPDKAKFWPRGLVWRPSAALLAECKLFMTPLQAVAKQLTRP